MSAVAAALAVLVSAVAATLAVLVSTIAAVLAVLVSLYTRTLQRLRARITEGNVLSSGLQKP